MSIVPKSKLKKAVTDFAEYVESQIVYGVDQAYSNYQTLNKELGDHPVGSRTASEREQLAEYLANKDNPEFWRQLKDNPQMGRTDEARKLRAFGYAAEMAQLLLKYQKELNNA